MAEVNKGIEILAIKLTEEVDELKELELKVKEKKKIINQLKTKDLAELVDAEGYQAGSKITLKNGRIITVKEFFQASIPSLSAIDKEKDELKQIEKQGKREKALKWLNDNGLADIIKNTVTAKFNKEEGDKAKGLLEWLVKKEISAVRDENVHPATLIATLKEVMGRGEEVPLETFGIMRGIVVDAK